jgi:NAD(P)-dependent dehydrogenase (short-subunit alcohol dehydrogenase family)
MNCARKHTLVTGCSSGIGRSTALRLARDGQHVYAGIRKPADGDRLARSAAGGEITPVILDVTEPGHIAAAAAHHRRAHRGRPGWTAWSTTPVTAWPARPNWSRSTRSAGSWT